MSEDHRSRTRQSPGGGFVRGVQFEDDSSLRDQQRECRQQADSLGYRIPEELEFEDGAISGTKLHRPGLDQLLEQDICPCRLAQMAKANWLC